MGTNSYSMIIMLVAMVAIFYFLLIRPEKKRKKEEENLRSNLKVGDKITTIGGIVGKIVDMHDENIVIETSADRVRMGLAKWSVMTNNTAKENAQKARQEAHRLQVRAASKRCSALNWGSSAPARQIGPCVTVAKKFRNSAKSMKLVSTSQSPRAASIR